MTAFADVTGGMNPLQSAQALNTAQQGSRDEIDWANKQLLRNLQSAHTNDDGSLDQFGFIHAAASHSVGPEAVKAWLANQNDTYNTATNQSTTNMLLKTLNLNPNALRDQSKLPGQPGAGGMNSIDGEQIPAGQSIQYNNEQGAGSPQGNSTLNLDASPDTSDEVRARAAARANGAAAFVPAQPQQNQGQQTAGADAFTPKPVTGAKAMTFDDTTAKSGKSAQPTPEPNQVVVNARSDEANSGGTFTAPAPQDNSMSYTSTPDRRSILERLADSGSGTPTLPNGGTAATSNDNSNIFNYANVVKTGNLNLKQGVDATLAKMGKSQDQQGVDEILEQAAHGVPVPTPQMKEGRLDVLGYTQEVQAYGAKVMAAKTAAAKALADGNTTALSEVLGRDQYSMAKANQEKEFSQVSHPAISGYLPSPAEKQNLTDASGADKEIISLMQKPPSPNSAEWGAFKLMLGKSIIKGMNLPVGEGMVDAVGQQVQNGANIGDVVKSAANGLVQGGLSGAAANAAATGMVQAYQSALGINSIDGAKYLVKGTSDFIRNKWSAYGKGDKFDEFFPEYKGGVGGGPAAGKKTGPGAFTPKKTAGPLSGSSF